MGFGAVLVPKRGSVAGEGWGGGGVEGTVFSWVYSRDERHRYMPDAARMLSTVHGLDRT